MQKSISIRAQDTNTSQKNETMERWFVCGTGHNNGYSVPHRILDVPLVHQEGFEDSRRDAVCLHSGNNPLRVLLQKDRNLLFLKTDESWSFGEICGTLDSSFCSGKLKRKPPETFSQVLWGDFYLSIK